MIGSSMQALTHATLSVLSIVRMVPPRARNALLSDFTFDDCP
jgi:hypothetical protein